MTKGQIEAKICEIVTKFESDYMGRGPKQIKTEIVKDLIIIRLRGFLSPAEQKLTENENGVDLIKKVRTMLFENAIEDFKKLVSEVVGIGIVSIFSDVSTRTGEKIIIITLNGNFEESLR